MTKMDEVTRRRAVARLRLVALERHHEQERFLDELRRAEDIGLTHAEIGEVIDLHRSRVTQILNEAFGHRPKDGGPRPGRSG